MSKRSDSATSFPNTLGAAPADDDDPLRSGNVLSRPPAAAIKTELKRLIVFYNGLGKEKKALLSIRFRS